MSFWVEKQLEPKRAFRFIVKFLGMPDAAQWYATKATKPKIEISEQEHKFLNHTFYFPGRATWSEVSITLVDPATPDTIGNLMLMLESSGYVIPGNPNVLQSIAKNNAVDAAGGAIEILQLDADGNQSDDLVLEKWTLRNAWVKSITPSEVSYDSEELATVEIVIRYDFAELKTRETITGRIKP